MLKILNPSYIKAHCPYQIIVSGILIFFSFQLSAQEYQTYKNGYSYTESLNQFIELNKSKLGKENTLIIGKVYRLPLKTDTTTEVQKIQAKIEALPEKTVYEIFGKKYREITIKSKELAGAIYYLESGHGGPDPGAIGNLNGHILCEDEYAYDVKT